MIKVYFYKKGSYSVMGSSKQERTYKKIQIILYMYTIYTNFDVISLNHLLLYFPTLLDN